MAKIIVSVDNFSIVSKYNLETIKEVKRAKPNALVVYEGSDDNKEQVFAISTAETKGSYSRHGISFASETVADHKACFTTKIPLNVENVKNYVIDSAGMGIVYLSKIEDQIEAALAEIAQEREMVASCIEGLQD